MAGIGDGMSADNLIFYDEDGRPFNADGSPVDPEIVRRLEYRSKAWARWEAGEDVSTGELFGDVPDDAV